MAKKKRIGAVDWDMIFDKPTINGVNLDDGKEITISGAGGGTANLTIGTVSTLNAGQNATASITDGKLNLGIPKGSNGAKGDTGATGANGKDGTNGAKGADGKSVTAIALTKDTSGNITGGTATLTGGTQIPITVTVAGA